MVLRNIKVWDVTLLSCRYLLTGKLLPLRKLDLRLLFINRATLPVFVFQEAVASFLRMFIIQCE